MKQLATLIRLTASICVASSLFFLHGTACAEPRILVSPGMNFGYVIPRANRLTIVLDGNGTRLPVCSPASDCDVSGGHTATLYFYDFGDVTISLEFPIVVRLYDEDGGEQGATISGMNRNSSVQAFTEGNRQKAYVGGVLLTGASAYGKKLKGTVTIEVTTK